MSEYAIVAPEDFDQSVFRLIGKEWMLVTAKNQEGKVNTMTASWGGFGVMWGKNVAVTVLRPQRYTKEFIDQSESFTLSFYDDTFKKDLSYLGSVSGRDEDKIAKTRLTPTDANGIPFFEEAKIVLICKKLYSQPMEDIVVALFCKPLPYHLIGCLTVHIDPAKTLLVYRHKVVFCFAFRVI